MMLATKEALIILCMTMHVASFLYICSLATHWVSDQTKSGKCVGSPAQMKASAGDFGDAEGSGAGWQQCWEGQHTYLPSTALASLRWMQNSWAVLIVSRSKPLPYEIADRMIACFNACATYFSNSHQQIRMRPTR